MDDLVNDPNPKNGEKEDSRNDIFITPADEGSGNDRISEEKFDEAVCLFNNCTLTTINDRFNCEYKNSCGLSLKNSSDIMTGMESIDEGEISKSRVNSLINLINGKKKVMILMRGIPGSGKSTLANYIIESTMGKDLQKFIYSTDNYFIEPTTVKYVFNHKVLHKAHSWNIKHVQMAVVNNISPIIIDNTNLDASEMWPYTSIAINAGYIVQFLEPHTHWRYNAVECSRRNVHGVTLQHLLKMLQRFDRNISETDFCNIFNSNQMLLDCHHRDSEEAASSKKLLALKNMSKDNEIFSLDRYNIIQHLHHNCSGNEFPAKYGHDMSSNRFVTVNSVATKCKYSNAITARKLMNAISLPKKCLDSNDIQNPAKCHIKEIYSLLQSNVISRDNKLSVTKENCSGKFNKNSVKSLQFDSNQCTKNTLGIFTKSEELISDLQVIQKGLKIYKHSSSSEKLVISVSDTMHPCDSVYEIFFLCDGKFDTSNYKLTIKLDNYENILLKAVPNNSFQLLQTIIIPSCQKCFLDVVNQYSKYKYSMEFHDLVCENQHVLEVKHFFQNSRHCFTENISNYTEVVPVCDQHASSIVSYKNNKPQNENMTTKMSETLLSHENIMWDADSGSVWGSEVSNRKESTGSLVEGQTPKSQHVNVKKRQLKFLCDNTYYHNKFEPLIIPSEVISWDCVDDPISSWENKSKMDKHNFIPGVDEWNTVENPLSSWGSKESSVSDCNKNEEGTSYANTLKQKIIPLQNKPQRQRSKRKINYITHGDFNSL